MIGLTIFKQNGPTQVLSGIWLVALTAMAALYAANIPFVKSLGLSPLLLAILIGLFYGCLLYTSPSPRDRTRSRMPSSA